MFPRGYFIKVGRFVFWIIVTLLGLLGLAQLLMRAETRGDGRSNDELIPPDYASNRLWKCDCSDAGTHYELEFHGRSCGYRYWYQDEINDRRKNQKKGGE